MLHDVDEIDLDAMDEAMARLARGELREGLLWLGRTHEFLEPVLRLYDAEKCAQVEAAEPSGRRAA